MLLLSKNDKFTLIVTIKIRFISLKIFKIHNSLNFKIRKLGYGIARL